MAEPKTVIGIDANSHKLALVWKRRGSQTPHLKTFELSVADQYLACAETFRYLSEWFFEATESGTLDPSNTVVYIEAPIQGVGGPGPTIAQAFIQGSVYAWAGEFSLPCTKVNNQSWKKKICGAGNINKLEVTRRMREVWPELLERVPIIEKSQGEKIGKNQPDQDLVDAGAIHLFGVDAERLVAKVRRIQNGQGRKIKIQKAAV